MKTVQELPQMSIFLLTNSPLKHCALFKTHWFTKVYYAKTFEFTWLLFLEWKLRVKPLTHHIDREFSESY